MLREPFLGLNKIRILEDAPSRDDERVDLQDLHDRRSRETVDVIETDADPCLAPDKVIEHRFVGHEILDPWNLCQGPAHLRRSPHVSLTGALVLIPDVVVGLEHVLWGKVALGMVQLVGMEQPEGIRVGAIDIRTQRMDIIERVIVMVLVGAADEKLTFSKALGEETEHDQVPFRLGFIEPAEMRTPITCVSAESKTHNRQLRSS